MIDKLREIGKRISCITYLFWLVKKIEKTYFLKVITKRKFKNKNGIELDLKNPSGFNEKIQWIKLNIRNPLMTRCADKISVRSYVSEKCDNVYLPKVFYISDTGNDIDFSKLPSKFVIKSNHASGQIIIVKNKKDLNYQKTIDSIKFWLKENYFYRSGEWCYKDIVPKVYIEELLDDDMIDYKFYCFNGEPKFLYVSRGLGYDHKNGEMCFKWLNWENTPFQRKDFKIFDANIDKPKNLENMIAIAKKLSKDFYFCRVDLYNSDKYGIIFSELTFYPSGGYALFYPIEWENKVGKWLKIPFK